MPHENNDNFRKVWVYVDTSRPVGDKNHIVVFADEASANEWLEENDPEGVAFAYDVIG